MSDAHLDSLGTAPGQPIQYPMNAVVGVLDTHEQLDHAVQTLTAGGFLESELHVAAGPAAADALHATTGRTGLTGLAARIATVIGAADDEMEYKAHHERAIRDGRFVLVVEAKGDARKERASELLQAAGAHSVSYHGRFTIEGIVPPRDPIFSSSSHCAQLPHRCS